MTQIFGTLHRVGDPEEVPGSWLRIGIASAFVLIGQKRFLSVSPPLCISDFLIKKKNLFLKREVKWLRFVLSPSGRAALAETDPGFGGTVRGAGGDFGVTPVGLGGVWGGVVAGN